MGSHSRLKIIMPDELNQAIAQQPAPRPVSTLELRPLARVERIALIGREVREYLSQAALDAVFARAEVMSEGEVSGVQGRSVFLGSTMLTCDVATLGRILREPADEGTARRLTSLLGKEPSLDSRTLPIVRQEVTRITGKRAKSVRGETRLRTQGTKVFLDIDVEAILS